MHEDLKIILYPDPRLKKMSATVTTFDPALRTLSERMLELMREARGVGLAAPQVGQNIRLFVMNHSGKPEDDRVYANPALTEAEGEEQGEEGCLSLPGINGEILRSLKLRLQAQDLAGNPVDLTESGYIARIWQHEVDHLNGTLLVDRMGPVARMATRRTLKELEERWLEEHPEQARASKRKA